MGSCDEYFHAEIQSLFYTTESVYNSLKSAILQNPCGEISGVEFLFLNFQKNTLYPQRYWKEVFTKDVFV